MEAAPNSIEQAAPWLGERSFEDWKAEYDERGFDDAANLDHYLNASGSVRTSNNKYGLNSSINYDILKSTLTQGRVSAFYNAQCCGLAFEYQRYHFPTAYVIPSDHRFLLSFTLAGLGNFSPFSGGLSGVPR